MTTNYIQKNVSTFGLTTPHSQKPTNFFPSKLTKIYIRGPFATPFFLFKFKVVFDIKRKVIYNLLVIQTIATETGFP